MAGKLVKYIELKFIILIFNTNVWHPLQRGGGGGLNGTHDSLHDIFKEKRKREHCRATENLKDRTWCSLKLHFEMG